MRVLFINSYISDYQQDLIYNGLARTLGKDNIVDYPFNIHYHFKYRKYPANLGFTSKGIFDFVKSRLKYQIDIVIVGAAKKDCFESYLKIINSIPDHVPIVFLDGGDSPEIGGDLIAQGHKDLYRACEKKRTFDFVFKREYLIGREFGQNVFSLPFSYNTNVTRYLNLNNHLFKYDVSFWATESHKIRTEVLKLLKDKFDCMRNGSVSGNKFLFYDRKGEVYLEELKACKIVLNFRGGGWDTLRYWEVPACARFLISGEPQIYIPNGFDSGINIIYCKDNLSDLIDLCEYYLNNDDERETIAKNSYKHLLKFHTNTVRAEFLINTVKGNT